MRDANDPLIVELDVYIERDGVDAHVGAIELPLRDQEKWREIEGNLVRGQVVEISRETIGRALLGLTDEDEQALGELPGKLEQAAESHAFEWLYDHERVTFWDQGPGEYGTWRRWAVWEIIQGVHRKNTTGKEILDEIESILLWPKGADL